MAYVKVFEFVEALETIGISFPKNTLSAIIKLGPDAPVKIECEVLMESFVDTTRISDGDRSVKMGPSKTVATRRFLLVEEEDKEAMAERARMAAHRGLYRST